VWWPEQACPTRSRQRRAELTLTIRHVVWHASILHHSCRAGSSHESWVRAGGKGTGLARHGELLGVIHHLLRLVGGWARLQVRSALGWGTVEDWTRGGIWVAIGSRIHDLLFGLNAARAKNRAGGARGEEERRMERRGPSWIRSGIAAAGVGKGRQGYQSGGLAGGCRGGGWVSDPFVDARASLLKQAVPGSLVQAARCSAGTDMTRYACLNDKPDSRPSSRWDGCVDGWDGMMAHNRGVDWCTIQRAAQLWLCPWLVTRPLSFPKPAASRGAAGGGCSRRALQGRMHGGQAIDRPGRRPTGLPPVCFAAFLSVSVSGSGTHKCRGWAGVVRRRAKAGEAGEAPIGKQI
jgi:hypothetical protein